MRIARLKLDREPQYAEAIGTDFYLLGGTFPDLSRVVGAPSIPASTAKVLTPTLPTKIIAIGPGQREALKGRAAPERPLLFYKPPPSSLTHPGDPITFPPGVDLLTHEVEIAIVIGRTARHVAAPDASQFIAGYTVSNDLTVGNPSDASGTPLLHYFKSYDGMAPLGPVIVTDLKSSDLHGLRMQCRVNGELRTDSRCDLIYSPEELVSWMSHIFTLYPGDIISTGTPALGPLAPGDTVEVEVEGIGSLRNLLVKYEDSTLGFSNDPVVESSAATPSLRE